LSVLGLVQGTRLPVLDPVQETKLSVFFLVFFVLETMLFREHFSVLFRIQSCVHLIPFRVQSSKKLAVFSAV
jgi:hypothetical protein